MPAAAHKAAISFGLVYIPVALYTATQENRVSFNQLHRDSHARIRYKKVREDTGEEVPSDEIVKGYQYSKDQYIVLSEEEMERLKTPKDRAITILQFVPQGSIDPVFHEKTYFVIPEGGEKAYNLLLESMRRENVVAVAKTVLGTKETMLTLIPQRDGIVMETLHFSNEVRPMPKSVVRTEVTDAEIDMGIMLINAMKGEFRPELYRDEYEEKLMEAIRRKLDGQEIVAVKQAEAPDDVANLMDALKKSLEEMAKREPELAGVR